MPESSRDALPGMLSAVMPPHPRLMATGDEFARIRCKVLEHETANRWYRHLREKADVQLKAELPVYRVVGHNPGRLLQVSREVLDRIGNWSFLYQITQEEPYLQRASETLEAAADFPDWHPEHFLDTAEMTRAFAVGYDWLYSGLDESQKSDIRNAIVNHGLLPALESYRAVEIGTPWGRHGWVKVAHNWNLVCHAGIGMGALAVAEEFPKLCSDILQEVVENLPAGLGAFGQDGDWEEGPTYWAYSIRYLVPLLASMNSALGTDFGLSDDEGLSNTGDFPMALAGPSGKAFDFGDADENAPAPPELWWLARRYHKPHYAWWRLKHMGSGKMEDLLWYREDLARLPEPLPQSRWFKTSALVVFRGSWHDPDSLYFAIKGGDNAVNHGDLDAGTFVLDYRGVRWAEDLGKEDYAVPGYWNAGENGARWNYYRKRAEGHNTIVLENGVFMDQTVHAKAPVITYRDDAEKVFASLDLTPVYRHILDDANFVHRCVSWDRGLQLQLTDRFGLSRPSDVRWSMHTRAEITLNRNGKEAILSYGGKSIRILLESAAHLRFAVKSVEQATPKEGGAAILPRTGLRKLVIVVKNVTIFDLKIVFKFSL